MKIALIRRRGSAIGGAERYADRLMRALLARGHDVHLLAEAWDGLVEGVRLHPITVKGSRAVRPARFAEAAETLAAKEHFDCVFSLERTLRQDVYRAGDGVHRVWLERRRQFSPWWKQPFIGRGAFHRTMQALETATFDPTRTGRVIVNSLMVRDEILRNFPFPADRIHLVRNGVETAKLQGGDRSVFRNRFGIAEGESLLLFVGSGWERKGLGFAIQALGHPSLAGKPVKLLVLGKGKAPSAPSNVVFGGTTDALADAYAAADLLVFPPIYEPSANVVFEALAAGVPVVTSAFNGAGEVLQEGVNGSVVANPADIGALAAAIARWIERKARINFDTASIDLARNVDETLAILEQAASERRPR